MTLSLRRFWRWLVKAMALVIIAYAVLLNLGRALAPSLDQHRSELQQWVSKALNQPVKIAAVSATWYGFQPEIVLRDVTVYKHQRALFKIEKLAVKIDLWHSLWRWQWMPAKLVVSGANLLVYQDSSLGIHIYGLGSHEANASNVADINDLSQWLLTKADVDIDNVNLHWLRADGTLLPLHDIRLRIRNGLLHHRLSGTMQLAEPSATHLQFVLDVNTIDWQKRQINAEGYVAVDRLSLHQWVTPALSKQFLSHVDWQKARVSGRAWFHVQNNQLTQWQSVFDLRNIGLNLHSLNAKLAEQTVKVNRFAANLLWQRNQHGFSVTADKVHLELNHHLLAETKFGYSVKQSAHGVLRELATDKFGLEDLQQAQWLKNIIPASYQGWLDEIKNAQPHGQFTDIVVSLNEQSDKSIHGTSLRANFSDLGFKPVHSKWPAVNHLDGSVLVTPKGGVLNITSDRPQIQWDEAMSRPLNAEKLKGQVTWDKAPNGWHASLNQVEYQVDQMHFAVNALLMKLTNQPWQINLKGSASIADLAMVKNVIPDRFLHPPLANWLKQAFVAGSVPYATISWQGSIADFPYRQQPQQFLISAKMKDAEINYAKQWPSLTKLNGSVEFTGVGMKIVGNSANIGGNPLRQIHATINDWRSSFLKVSAVSETHVHDGIAFLLQAPMGYQPWLQYFDGKGGASVKLSLAGRLRGEHTRLNLAGNLVLHDATLNWLSAPLSLTGLNGELAFTNTSLKSPLLTATFDHQPATLKVSTDSSDKAQQGLRIQLNSVFDSQAWQQQWWGRVSPMVKGKAPLQLTVDVKDRTAAALVIRSNLQGIAITGLPNFISKLATEKKTLQLQTELKAGQPLLLKGRYGDAASAALRFQQTAKGWQLNNGQVLLGQGQVQAELPEQPGLAITATIPVLDWQQWQHYFSASWLSFSGSDASKSKIPIRQVSLRAKQVKLPQLDLQDVVFDINPRADLWDIDLQSKQLTGELQIPKLHSLPWLVDIEKLSLPKMAGKGGDISWLKKLPNLRATVADFEYDNKSIGAITLIASPGKQVWHVEKLTVQNADYSLFAKGNCYFATNQPQSDFHGVLQARDFGHLLNLAGWTSMVSNGRGLVEYQLRWQGLPWQLNLSSLSGDIKVNAHDGNLLKVSRSTQNEIGLGRILNILSLQSIPQRLALNFSDLAKKGFHFRTMKGNIAVANGDAVSNNWLVDGSVAKVSLRGRVGLNARDYDLNMTVIPYVTSSVPLIAGIFGGPIAGVAAWVGNQLIGPEIGRAFGSHYKITGHWDKPTFVKLH